MATVSVIVVTYNSEETVLACLGSLLGQRYRDFEVIVVDNSSCDRTRELIESFRKEAPYPLEAIYLEKNRGFPSGNNLALKRASGRYIALLNPDAVADAYWLQELVKAMGSNAEIGIAASKILTMDSKGIDSAGDIMLSTFRSFKRESLDPGMYQTPELVFGACAAGALYRRSMIEEIGFFDEDFFIQCEDTDLSFRAQLGGWKVLYVPGSLVRHRVGHSIGKASEGSVYYSQRNMEFVRVKNIPLTVLLKFSPQMAAGFLADLVYFGFKLGRLRPFIRAKVDAMRMLPAMLEKRRRIMRGVRKVPNAYIRSLVTPMLLNRDLLSIKLRRLVEKNGDVGINRDVKAPCPPSPPSLDSQKPPSLP